MGQKIRPRVSEDFLGPKVTTPEILGSAEISTGLGVFLKILGCRENFGLPDFLKIMMKTQDSIIYFDIANIFTEFY